MREEPELHSWIMPSPDRRQKAGGITIASRRLVFTPRSVESREMPASKRAVGIPDNAQSCATGIVEGQFVKGNLPASDTPRLFKERPEALGLAVPDMQFGSPSMEILGVAPETFEPLLVGADGWIRMYAGIERPFD